MPATPRQISLHIVPSPLYSLSLSCSLSFPLFLSLFLELNKRSRTIPRIIRSNSTVLRTDIIIIKQHHWYYITLNRLDKTKFGILLIIIIANNNNNTRRRNNIKMRFPTESTQTSMWQTRICISILRVRSQTICRIKWNDDIRMRCGRNGRFTRRSQPETREDRWRTDAPARERRWSALDSAFFGRQSRKRIHRCYTIPSCSPLHITLHVKHWDDRAYFARSSFRERELFSRSRRRFRRNDDPATIDSILRRSLPSGTVNSFITLQRWWRDS